MKKYLLFISILVSICSFAQTPSGSKTRYPGMWLSSKDTANATSADSIAMLANRADGSLRWRYSVTDPWKKVLTSYDNDFIRNQTGSNLSAQTAKFYVTDTVRTNGVVLGSKVVASTFGNTGGAIGVLGEWRFANNEGIWTVNVAGSTFSRAVYQDNSDTIRIGNTTTPTIFNGLGFANGANRIALPNASGTIALTSDIPVSGTFTNRRIPFANSSGQLKDTTGFEFKAGGLFTPGSVNVNGATADANAAMSVKASSGTGQYLMYGRDNSDVLTYSLKSDGSANFNGLVTASGGLSSTTGAFSGAVSASSFSGAGTGLTGTASGLSIGGTAAGETFATVTGRGASTNTSITLDAGAVFSVKSSLSTVTTVMQCDNTAGYIGTNSNHILNIRVNSTTIGTFNTAGLSMGSNSLSAGAISGTTGTFTGLLESNTLNVSSTITSLNGNNSTVLNAASATTSYQIAINQQNTSGRMQIGLEGSVAGTLATGNTAYSTNVVTVGNTDIAISPNQTTSFLAKASGRILLGTTTDDGSNKLQVNGGIKGITGDFSSNVNIANASRLQFNSGDAAITNSGTSLYLQTYNGSVLTTGLTINSSQAATFAGTLGINGVSDNVKSGTYTPTATNESGTSSYTVGVAQYIRVGNVVTVSGTISLSSTSSSINSVRLSLPIASDFTNENQCRGVAATQAGSLSVSGIIKGYAFFDEALLVFYSPDSAYAFSYTYTYTIN